MIHIVSEYTNYIENIENFIKQSPYKTSYFFEQLGMSKPTFYRKLKEHAFTLTEVTTLTRLLFPKETYKQDLLNSINEAREDIKEGNTMTSEDMRQAMRDKIQAYQ